MAGVPRLSEDERRAREEKQSENSKEYYSDPEIKLRQKLYYQKYFKQDYAKESHSQAQERYRNTAKGKATTVRYWKKKNSKQSSSRTKYFS